MAFVHVANFNRSTTKSWTAPLCSVVSSRTSVFHGSSHIRVQHVPIPARAITPCTMNISSNDFRNGTSIALDGVPFRVVEFLHVKPGKGAAFVRTKLKNMRTGNNVEKTFKAGEVVPSANLTKSTVQHTYIDGDDFVFMDIESYEEERMTGAILGDNVVKFLKIGQDVELLKFEEELIGVDLPKTIIFEITDTEPGAKGNTAQGNALKRAVIETGAEVMVPLFINEGESIKVNVPEGTYAGRSNE